MGSNRKRKVYKNDITFEMMRGISLRFVKRLSIPMFHPKHVKQVADVFKETAEDLSRISSLTNLRQVDRLIQSHITLNKASMLLATVKPNDPRPNGSEQLEYDDNYGLIDVNGLDELDEMLTKEYPENAETKPSRYFQRYDETSQSYYKSKKK